MKKKNLGFTLAEVLIVIGIIGVVAALTLPNLNHATGDKEKVTKVKKIYSALTEAVDRAQAIYGPFDTWFNDLNTTAEKSERFAKRVTEFMKVSKNCGVESGCFSSMPLFDLNGTVLDGTNNYLSKLSNDKAYMLILTDGLSIAFDYSPYQELCKIKVDIDGPNKGKNQAGNDIFDFSVYTDETIANRDGVNMNEVVASARPKGWTGNINNYSQYETAWVIENGNLDYLKCPDELNWETKTSCE